MNKKLPIESAVKKRISVRNYADMRIEETKMSEIKEFVSNTDNPFSQHVNFHFFDLNDSGEGQKLGTYGVIKGAQHYLGASVKPVPLALVAVGYQLETIMLYLAQLDIGTCWLGGTFDRKGFSLALSIESDEVLPAITPFGYAKERRHLQEVVMRTFIQAHKRFDWDKLF
ncbi:MAG: nitroreductase, partial [Firmicutes bacterium HGW-Firmicutes-20]